MVSFSSTSPAPTTLARRADAFASLVLTGEGERRRVNVSPRRAELTVAVVAAVTAFLDVRTRRFPRLASCLPLRFATDSLPCSTVRALRGVASGAFAAQWHSASVRKSRVILSRFEILAPARGLGIRRTREQALAAGFASVAEWNDAICAQMGKAARINAQIDALLVLVRKVGTRSEYNARCARAHAALLEDYRATALRAA